MHNSQSAEKWYDGRLRLSRTADVSWCSFIQSQDRRLTASERSNVTSSSATS